MPCWCDPNSPHSWFEECQSKEKCLKIFSYNSVTKTTSTVNENPFLKEVEEKLWASVTPEEILIIQ